MICGCEQSHIDLSVYDQEFLLGVFLEFSSQITGYVLIGTLKRKKENLSFSLSMPTLDSFFFFPLCFMLVILMDLWRSCISGLACTFTMRNEL